MSYLGMLNDFLMTDINENIDFCDEVLIAINNSSKKISNFCGNVYELKITANKAILTNLHDEAIHSETIALSELQQKLTAWRKKISTP